MLDRPVNPTAKYARYLRRKTMLLAGAAVLMVVVCLASLGFGSVSIPLRDIAGVLTGEGASAKWSIIVYDVRLPRILTAVFAGAGLAASGTVMQSVLRNPLASPFTLGISQAAAFGAALSVTLFETGAVRSSVATAITITEPYVTTVSAFALCLLTTSVLIAISRLRRASPEMMVLTGVALGSLFGAGTMLLQYFSDDVQLAAMVFWTFGDVGRTNWQELALIVPIVSASCLFFFTQRWKYNALDAGDETAMSLGIPAERVRVVGMVVASLVTAAVVSFIGIIGFIGLVCPHMMRRLVGDDHRFLFPGACLAGSIVLVAADTTAKLILVPHVFPVAILTSFLGVPVFMYLIVRGYRR